jgi:hypothetical protein
MRESLQALSRRVGPFRVFSGAQTESLGRSQSKGKPQAEHSQVACCLPQGREEECASGGQEEGTCQRWPPTAPGLTERRKILILAWMSRVPLSSVVRRMAILAAVSGVLGAVGACGGSQAGGGNGGSRGTGAAGGFGVASTGGRGGGTGVGGAANAGGRVGSGGGNGAAGVSGGGGGSAGTSGGASAGKGGGVAGSGGNAPSSTDGSATDSGSVDAAPLSGDCLRLYECCVGAAAQTPQFCTSLVAQGICGVWLQSYALAGIQCPASATGTAGAGGASGAGGVAGAGGGLALPACAIFTRPNDPSDGGYNAGTGVCNTLPLSGTPVSPQTLVQADAGAQVSGGVELPVGGQILDGDYEFATWLDDSAGGPSRREIRVFGGGTYIEWAATIAGAGTGGADATVKYDTTASVAGHTITFLAYTCGNEIGIPSFGYTASGDELTFYDNAEALQVGAVVSVDTYGRTCTRP